MALSTASDERGLYPVLRNANRIWVVGAIHGDLVHLEAVHDEIAPLVHAGDRLVYLGNYLGHGYDSAEVVNELLRFRSWFLSLPPFVATGDIVFLRGQQEEMFEKLLQVQFAAQPEELLTWLLEHGVESTLLSYGTDAAEAFKAAGEGTLSLTYWTSDLRARMRLHPGHDRFFRSLKRAVYTDDGGLLFVSAGIDVEKPLVGQTDPLWWAVRSFVDIDAPYRGFRKIVRGTDAEPRGIVVGENTISLDSGAGRGGQLSALCVTPNADILHQITK